MTEIKKIMWDVIDELAPENGTITTITIRQLLFEALQRFHDKQYKVSWAVGQQMGSTPKLKHEL